MKIGLSLCFAHICCTYKAGHHRLSIIEKMYRDGVAIGVCPEVYGGLNIPREPAEIQSTNPLVIKTITGKDVTKEYVEGASIAFDICKNQGVDVMLLKSRSPSCGKDGIYDGTFQHRVVDGAGVFAKLCLENEIKVFHEEEIDEFLNYIREDEFYGTYLKNATSV